MSVILQNSNTVKHVLTGADRITDVAWDSIDKLATGIVSRLPYLIAGALVLLVFYALARIFRGLFLVTTKRIEVEDRLRTLIFRLIYVLIIIVGVFTALSVIVPSFEFGDLIAGLGFTSFVIGFATKDILNNFLSGMLILWQQPFKIGDHIYIGNNQGKVEEIGVRATSLRKDDGEKILIPNGEMYSSTLTIHKAGEKRRVSMQLNLKIDSETNRAKELTLSTLKRVDGVLGDPDPSVLVTEIKGEGVIVTVDFWIDTDDNKPREVFDRAANEIISAFDEAGIRPFVGAVASVGEVIAETVETKKKKRNDLGL